MKVKQVMSKSLVCCTPTDSSRHAAELMKQHQIGALPIVQSQEKKLLLGIVTDRDLSIKLIAEGLGVSIPVSEVMTSKPIACSADDSLEACESLMQKHKVRRIPVIDEQGQCVGMVAQADIVLHDDAKHIQRTLNAISAPLSQAA